MTPTRGYLLCCIERTGSNLLAQALSATHLAGRPIEYFNPVMQGKEPVRAILGEETLVTGFPKILAAGTTPNGVFGCKLHWSHLPYLGMILSGDWSESQRLAPRRFLQSLRSRSPDLLPVAVVHGLLRSRGQRLDYASRAHSLFQSCLTDLRFIWLSRRNRVARAVSHFRALRSGVWHRPPTSTIGESPRPEYDFDAGEIHDLYCLGGFQEECWQRFFERHRITPLQVEYEDLVTDYDATVRRVLTYLGLESTAAIPSPRTRQQADETSGDWELRYRELIARNGLE